MAHVLARLSDNQVNFKDMRTKVEGAAGVRENARGSLGQWGWDRIGNDFPRRDILKGGLGGCTK